MPLNQAAFVTATVTGWLSKTRKHRQRSVDKSLFASMMLAICSLAEGVLGLPGIPPEGLQRFRSDRSMEQSCLGCDRPKRC